MCKETCIKMIKSNSNNIYNVIKDAVLSNILRILKKKKISGIPQKYYAANQHIKLISEGSFETEDWHNGRLKIQLCHLRINNLLKYDITVFFIKKMQPL